MITSKDIQLNFLEISEQHFDIKVFTLPYREDVNQPENYSRRRLNKADFWVGYSSVENSEELTINSFENIGITKEIIFYSLTDKLKESDLEFHLSENKYDKYIAITISKNRYGAKTIELRPYFLQIKSKFGFLIDYSFVPNAEGLENRKECLIYDGTLIKDNYGNYRSNKDNYIFKYYQLNNFIEDFLSKISPFVYNDIQIVIKPDLIEVSSNSLSKKKYVFGSNEKDFSQFMGIRKYGVYKGVEEKIKYVFVYDEKHRTFVVDLYNSLLGKLYPETFRGLKDLFGITISNEQILPIKIQNESKEELMKAIQQISEYKTQFFDFKIITIFIENTKNEDLAPINSPYFILKYYLTKEQIPVQVVNYTARSQTNALKWSSSNIGLQIFSKLGGIPWIVEPTNKDCLILGIGSSYIHSSKKTFAYSVCLDSSGIYKKLEILAEGTNQENYLQELEKNLVQLLKSDEYSNYKKCVLHLPFKIKYKEIEAIEKAINELKNIEFKAIKINVNNKFFGFSQHSTKVPYESSFIELSRNEYLVWFQGLQYGKELVSDRVSNPVHIQFLYLEGQQSNNNTSFLQDIINLSGTNWRGFNAKLEPISIYYAHLVAEFSSAFEKFEDFDEDIFKTEYPWFL